MAPPVDPGDRCCAWGAPRLRDLPWRATRDPWRILVAEIMLQQTQVPRVIPKWLAFGAAYPTPAACAAAPLGDVLRHWQGLGYPRRARNLHDAATAMVAEHGGAVPDDLDALRALPGIGPYTARAVLAFAFERDVAVVDTNIARVLARVAGARLTLRQAQDGGRRPRAAGRRVGVEPDADGPRRDGLPAGAALRRVPAGGELRVAGRRAPGARPGRRIGGRQHAARRRTPAAIARRGATCCGRSTTVPARRPSSRRASSPPSSPTAS